MPEVRGFQSSPGFQKVQEGPKCLGTTSVKSLVSILYYNITTDIMVSKQSASGGEGKAKCQVQKRGNCSSGQGANSELAFPADFIAAS